MPSRELRKQGMKQPIVAGVGVNDPRFIQIAGAATEGVMAAFDFFAAESEAGGRRMGRGLREALQACSRAMPPA